MLFNDFIIKLHFDANMIINFLNESEILIICIIINVKTMFYQKLVV
jgi:hypothetical protein